MLPFLYGYQTTRSGDPIQPTVLATPACLWEEMGNLTATQAQPAVNARDYSAIWTTLTDANTIKYTVPNDASGIEIRFHTKANADAHIVEMWMATASTYRDGTTEEHFMLGATFTITGGQQTGPHSNVFCDTMTVAENVIEDGAVTDSANDRVSVYRCDLRGYKKLVFIATTFQAATTLYADIRYW